MSTKILAALIVAGCAVTAPSPAARGQQAQGARTSARRSVAAAGGTRQLSLPAAGAARLRRSHRLDVSLRRPHAHRVVRQPRRVARGQRRPDGRINRGEARRIHAHHLDGRRAGGFRAEARGQARRRHSQRYRLSQLRRRQQGDRQAGRRSGSRKRRGRAAGPVRSAVDAVRARARFRSGPDHGGKRRGPRHAAARGRLARRHRPRRGRPASAPHRHDWRRRCADEDDRRRRLEPGAHRRARQHPHPHHQRSAHDRPDRRRPEPISGRPDGSACRSRCTVLAG